jgi:hypothetical protein
LSGAVGHAAITVAALAQKTRAAVLRVASALRGELLIPEGFYANIGCND